MTIHGRNCDHYRYRSPTNCGACPFYDSMCQFDALMDLATGRCDVIHNCYCCSVSGYPKLCEGCISDPDHPEHLRKLLNNLGQQRA